MKLTAELIARAPCYLNALRDRELDLRSNKIPAIENLGATKDLNDSLDLTDNDIRVLGNFPSLPRLKTLLMANNRISKIEATLSQYVPHLTTVVLTNNSITELSDCVGLAGCGSLEYLVLLDNPVAKKKYYRQYIIWKLPSVRVLDFTRIRKAERQEAKSLFETKSGKPSALAESIEATKSASTFEPGEGVPLPEKSGVPTLTALSKEDQDKIKAALVKATTLEEMGRLERALKEGKLPHYLKEQDGGSSGDRSAKRQKVAEGSQQEEEEAAMDTSAA